MNVQTDRPVVVGVDGSAAAAAALRWALDEACCRARPLRIVHAAEQAHSDAFIRANPVFVAEEREADERILDAAVEHARTAAPGVDICGVREVGEPSAVLLAQARAAEIVVLGSRGRGGFSGLLLGSTSLKVAMRAACPVVVCRPAVDAASARPSAGRVVVGADGTPCSDPAVRFAFAQARRRGCGLTAVRARRSPVVHVEVPAWDQWTQWAKEEQVVLSDIMAPWRERYPEVDVVERSVFGNPSAVLVDESAGAGLLVVGSHGRGGVGGLLLGSVSHAVLHHARCPVAVVRAPSDS
jgi:nucleotide-binding universal stress UspA family protein